MTADGHSHTWSIAPENSELRMRGVQEHQRRHDPCDCLAEELGDMPIYACECGLLVAWPDEPDF